MIKKKKISGNLIFNILVAGLCVFMVLFFFFGEDGLNDLLSSGMKISIVWILAAVGCQLIYMLLETIVIYCFIHQDYKHFTFFDSLKVSFVGLFWCAVTPSSTGGQPMQIYLLHSMKVDVGYATSRLIQKFLIYQIVLTSISVLAFVYKFEFFTTSLSQPVIFTFVVVGFVSQFTITGALILVSFWPKLTKKFIFGIAKLLSKVKILKNLEQKARGLEEQLDIFHSSNKELYHHKKTLAVTFLLTFAQFIAMFTVPYCVYRALGLTGATPLDMISSQAFVNLVSGMIPIPGASGAAEVGFTAFFNGFFTTETLMSATLIWRMINYYGVVVVTAPFAYITNGKSRKGKVKQIANSDKTIDDVIERINE